MEMIDSPVKKINEGDLTILPDFIDTFIGIGDLIYPPLKSKVKSIKYG